MNLQKIKKALRKIFFLPPVLTLLISVPSFGMVIYALTGENVNPAVSYAAYLLSAYALVITVTGFMGFVHLVRRGIGKHPFVRKMMGIPMVGRYFREDVFRAEISLYQGFFINLIYAGIKMFTGIHYKSVWFGTLAVYYILLAVMRFLLLGYMHKEEGDGENKDLQWRRYRLCGMILLFMNFALTGIIVLVVYRNSGFEYPGVLIYVMALYAFYAVITAVRNVIKFRKYKSPVLSAAKAVGLTAAMVSMLSLETAMLTQFGAADDADFRKLMTASTGAGVIIIVVGMAVYMIIHATKNLKRQRQERRGIL